jgi:hypothetical protein
MGARGVPQDDKDVGCPRCGANMWRGDWQDAYDCLPDGSVVWRLSVKIGDGSLGINLCRGHREALNDFSVSLWFNSLE